MGKCKCFKGKCLLGVFIYLIVAFGSIFLSHLVSPEGLKSLTWPPQPHPQFSFGSFAIDMIGKVIYYLLFYGVLYMAIRRTNNLPTIQ